jgi:hypothetical protein
LGVTFGREMLESEGIQRASDSEGAFQSDVGEERMDFGRAEGAGVLEVIELDEAFRSVLVGFDSFRAKVAE